jgi:hypothetical protein
MMPHPSGDWSVFQQSFVDHWEAFAHAHPRYQTPSYEGLGAKMLACGAPEQMGYSAYRCLRCGQGTHRVAMSCQAALCLRCATGPVDTWVSQVSQALHAGGIYRPIILTVPAMCRTPLSQHAAVVLSAFMRCGAQCLDDFCSTVRGKALRGGSITVLHTHGRHGQYHPPLHLSATSGGYDAQGRERAGNLCSTCPTISGVARGNGTGCAWCARGSRRRRSTRWWMRVFGSLPTASCPTCRRVRSPRSLRAWRVTWPRTW